MAQEILGGSANITISTIGGCDPDIVVGYRKTVCSHWSLMMLPCSHRGSVLWHQKLCQWKTNWPGNSQSPPSQSQPSQSPPSQSPLSQSPPSQSPPSVTTLAYMQVIPSGFMQESQETLHQEGESEILQFERSYSGWEHIKTRGSKAVLHPAQ